MREKATPPAGGTRPAAGRSRPPAGRAGGEEREPWIGLRPVNAVLLAAAVVAIVTGYILLDRGSVTAAPVLLVLGYAVLLPAGLAIGVRRGRGPEG